MNKLLYAIGALLIIGFICIGFSEMMRAQTRYVQSVSDLQNAPKGETVQFIGPVVPGSSKYSGDGRELHFAMKDESGGKLNVLFIGSKPNGFDTAPKVIVRGVYKKNLFTADQVQTKCPSKYEGK